MAHQRSRRERRGGPRPATPAPPPPLSTLPRPALVAAGLVAAAGLLLVLTTRLFDMDLWQHLAYGRALWREGRIPTVQTWTWPDYGAPEINASWGFRALVWPFWDFAGLAGLHLWRWLLALATFGLLWATARRLGARGLAALPALVVCALAYRQRAQIRPELLAGLLLAVQIWILEIRRQGGPDRSPWLVAIAWAWANVHLSYPLGFAVLGVHLAEAEWRARRGHAHSPARLWVVALAAAAVSLLNPFGLHGLAWPFQFAFQWRHEPMERDVAELAPLLWGQVWRAGVPLLVVGWPLLAIARGRWTRFDRVEAAICLVFTTLAVTGHRFVATYAIAAAPYLARGLTELVARAPAPAWARPLGARAALAATACVTAIALEWTNPLLRPGLGLEMPDLPIHACDFMRAAGVRGRGMNHFAQGGYQVWRFWPDRERLPFFTIHTEYGTPERRALYWRAFFGRPDWLALDQRYRFDYALLRYRQVGGDRLLDVLEADPAWALVFADDAAAVYVRRTGPLAEVARRHAYRVLGAGNARLAELNATAPTDSALRAELRRELELQAAFSPANSAAITWLAYLAMFEGRRDQAQTLFRRALEVNRHKLGAHLGLGLIALAAGRPREALVELQAERRLEPRVRDLAYHIGRAHLALGERKRARRWFRAELERYPDHAEARQALGALDLR